MGRNISVNPGNANEECSSSELIRFEAINGDEVEEDFNFVHFTLRVGIEWVLDSNLRRGSPCLYILITIIRTALGLVS